MLPLVNNQLKQIFCTSAILLDETHLDAVRGLILLKRFQLVHQQEELVGAMLLRSIRTKNGSS